MSEHVGLDFETYAAVNLPKHGLDRYVKCPHFTPLIARTYTLTSQGFEREEFDFVSDFDRARRDLNSYLQGWIGSRNIAAHNSPFEQAVLKAIGLLFDPDDFVDTAVLSRMWGAGGKLEVAAPQLLGIDKMEEGWDLIKLFSIPGPFQEANGSEAFDPDIVKAHPDEWHTFGMYCDVDAVLSHNLAEQYGAHQSRKEKENERITNEMNAVGWPVDLTAVHHMKQRYEENLANSLDWWYDTYQPAAGERERLNFNSFQQMKAWCAARGVKAKSFDELHVSKMLTALDKKLEGALPANVRSNYADVKELLLLKQELGGSSLKKLDTIIDMTSEDGRLRNQYLHIGAGQTWRTSGRGVQMQNLKRLGEELLDMDTLEGEQDIDSATLAQNLRQVFTSSDPDGLLIVGDFASVESRGLAYLADATWKLDAFRAGKDMYKVLASQMFHLSYDAVVKSQRQTGKVGELSCGYGAGPEAVKDFAEKMGTVFTLAEATSLVYDWRDVNPEEVAFWEKLDQMLHQWMATNQIQTEKVGPEGALTLAIASADTPASLLKQHPGARSMFMILRKGSTTIVKRVFHGCYIRGRSVGYYKPTDRKTGDLWKNNYTNPKTKQLTFYTIYGGKLTGILTQSLCREMFFHSMRGLSDALKGCPNVDILGQFHDEIVVDWRPPKATLGTGGFPEPGSLSEKDVFKLMHRYMKDPGMLKGFPLEAEIKAAYRYTK